MGPSLSALVNRRLRSCGSTSPVPEYELQICSLIHPSVYVSVESYPFFKHSVHYGEEGGDHSSCVYGDGDCVEVVVRQCFSLTVTRGGGGESECYVLLLLVVAAMPANILQYYNHLCETFHVYSTIMQRRSRNM